VHVRNVVTASAQEGARYAANADVPSDAGAAPLDWLRDAHRRRETAIRQHARTG
jgi:hypothetical protein